MKSKAANSKPMCSSTARSKASAGKSFTKYNKRRSGSTASSPTPITHAGTLANDTTAAAPVTLSLDPIARIKKSDPPIHTLILGTHPSVKSFAEGEMLTAREIRLRGGAGPQNYGNIRNCFWNIMGSGCGFRRDKAPYQAQKEALTASGFAVWDVVAACSRDGSLDSKIKGDVPNDIPQFLAEHKDCSRLVIAMTAANFFKKKQHFHSWLETGSKNGVTIDWYIRSGATHAPDTLKLFGKFKSVRVVPSTPQESILTRKSNSLCSTAQNHVKSRYFASTPELTSRSREVELVVLPSTSPASAKMRPATKELLWMQGCFGHQDPPAHYQCPMGCGSTHYFANCPHYNKWRIKRQSQSKETKRSSSNSEDDKYGWYY